MPSIIFRPCYLQPTIDDDMNDTSISHNNDIWSDLLLYVISIHPFLPQPRKSQVLNSLFNFDLSTCVIS